jgi:hypothetical protein
VNLGLIVVKTCNISTRLYRMCIFLTIRIDSLEPPFGRGIFSEIGNELSPPIAGVAHAL